MTELEQMTQLCVRLGASEAQAVTMAAQLLKRADQLAAERKIDRVAALNHLITVVVNGRNGISPVSDDDLGKAPPRNP